MRMASTMADSSETILTAPATCPSYPGASAATISAPQALTAATVSLPVPIEELHSASAAQAVARMSQIRTRAGRGPPPFSLA
jgi:hypothetical protein